MTDEEYRFIHDITNKLSATDGKIRKIKRTENLTEIFVDLEKIGTYNYEALKLLQAFKNYIEKRDSGAK